MTTEGYGMLKRALGYYGYEKADELKLEYLDRFIQSLRIKNGSSINVSGLSEHEYEMMAYRYGFFDGKIKLFMQTASTFSTTVEHVRRTEERTIMKIIKALKVSNGRKVK